MATFSLIVILREARRRRVFRVTAIYIVGAWVALQAADLAFPGLGIKESAILYVWIGAILGLPIALFFGWRYDIIGGRIVRTAVSDVDADLSIERADYIILVALSVVVAAIAFGLAGEILKTRVLETTPFAVTDIHPKSVAVLPFVNMSSDPEQEYFSDGISEDILNLLAQVPNLPVISRSSAFSFKGQNLDVPTIAAKLNVAHVLEGSVRKSGNQLRIVAQLIEVKTDTHLWSETYDRELKNVFAIQDEIAAAVVDALKIKLLGDAPKATPTDPEAYAAFLQGRHLMIQQDPDSVQKAEILLKQSLEFDAGFAPAWTALGQLYWRQARLGLRPADEADELQRQAFQEALAIDAQYGLALVGLALLEGDDTAASQYLQQAVASNPGDANALRRLGWVELRRGHLDKAIELTERSVALDPMSPLGRINLGYIYYLADRLDDAADSARMALALNPDALWAHYVLGIVLLAQGDAPAALVAMEQETSNYLRLKGIAIIQHALGDTEAADAALQALIERYPGEHYFIAQVYAFRGEIDQAFERLEQLKENPRSKELGQSWIHALHLDPLFSNLHDDPRWEAFLNAVGSPRE